MPKNESRISYKTYRTSTLGRRIGHMFGRKESIYSYLDTIFSDSEMPDASGFVFMYGQARRFPEVVDWCREFNVSVVHLMRENSLKILVSRQVAKSRGVYFSTRPLERTAVTLDVNRLEAALKKMDSTVEYHQHLFSTLPYTEVTYENLVTHRNVEFRRILEFLETDMDQELTTDVVKTSPDSLSMLIENYSEVCEVLRGSPYKRFLDDVETA